LLGPGIAVMHWKILRRHLGGGKSWLFASLVSWCLGGFLLALNDQSAIPWPWALMGSVYTGVPGVVLARMLSRGRAPEGVPPAGRDP
jgi:hypothetical protein